MKYIYLLLLCLLGLQACNDDKEVDWTPDALTVSSNELLEEAGDGHWKVTLPTEYQGAVKLDIQTDKAWGVEVVYMTNEEEEWITPSTQEGNGAATLLLNIADNGTSKDRKASVVITTKGEVPVKRMVTIIQGNVEELLSIGTIDEQDFPENISVTKDATSALLVTLPRDFTSSGERDLNILTYGGTASCDVEITFPNEEHGDWVVKAAEPVMLPGGREVKTLALTIKENTANVYREALVKFTATAGELTIEKTVKIIQYGEEKIVWNEEYSQSETQFIVSSDANERLLIATCENINPADLEVTGGKEWLELTQEEGKVYAKLAVNNSTNQERSSEIVIKNKKSGSTAKKTLKQGMYGYGIVLDKTSWKILGEKCSSNVQTQVNDGSIKKLINNEWTPNKSNQKHVQFDGGNDSNPYIFVFDLGDISREYTHLGLMPRLQWTAPAPKTVKIEVSADGNSWETVVDKVSGNGFTVAELKGESNTNDDHYEGIVRWFDLGVQQKRYIRLSVYETHWTNSKGHVLCLDEVFVADRSAVVE